jgi:hypothetical protein
MEIWLVTVKKIKEEVPNTKPSGVGRAKTSRKRIPVIETPEMEEDQEPPPTPPMEPSSSPSEPKIVKKSTPMKTRKTIRDRSVRCDGIELSEEKAKQ